MTTKFVQNPIPYEALVLIEWEAMKRCKELGDVIKPDIIRMLTVMVHEERQKNKP